ncbi:NAD(P)-dependent alcohol dehydrogenase [Olivibacter sp. SDN3]|uniref:NAD(P)-dependent alcohol dehydrogenase n=1 Tax=Olivibacter sp. SDN3 TaxID=2764720 RepID=UPI001C9E607F|nr:NAD(P)-dependent alcohol dehydrogenase [Olivibacter sp. SDN3]
MKAAVLEKTGVSPKFKIKEFSRPVIRNGQLLVKNYASSVNPIDVLVRQGKALLAVVGASSQIIGCDFCGKVIASRSRLFKEGDDVYGMFPIVKGGAYAEEIVINEDMAALKPDNLSYLEAGVIPLVGLTAYQGLFKVGRLQRGENILITGCTGGVGSAAVQLAKTVDAHISGLCREEHRPYAKELGCDVVIDYQQQKIPSGAQFDLIFDAAGKYTYSNLQHHLTEHGIFVTTRGETNNLKGFVKTTVDMVFENRMKFVMVKPNVEDLLNLKHIIEGDALKIKIAKTFLLDQLTEAHEMMEKGGFAGKIGVEIEAVG